ncbi:MAG: hypothetical protein KGO53_12780 [Alphaproteobacteria bacterium]|nr:hypothetical protein [Alphaproteobacteria bacterium]
MKMWKKRIGGCFGEKDKLFARHPSDAQNAFDLLADLREENVSWKEVRAEIKKYLEEWKVGDKQTKEELKKVKEKYKPWL